MYHRVYLAHVVREIFIQRFDAVIIYPNTVSFNYYDNPFFIRTSFFILFKNHITIHHSYSEVAASKASSCKVKLI